MIKLYTFLLFLSIPFLIKGQTTSDFESFDLQQDTFYNGSDGSGGFSDGNIFLPNSYDEMWSSWSGWSISNTTDTTTPGFTNQYSCIAGQGANGSETYATTFVLGESRIIPTNDAAGGTMEGFYVNNATYAYLSMRDGDNFAKKFGGESGDDPDYLLLTIKVANPDPSADVDSIDFYLADYRFADNSQDYLVDAWTYIDLEAFHNVDTLIMTLSSSDNGAFGMNTPAYFCIDDFTTGDFIHLSVNDIKTNPLKVYPNPVSEVLNIDMDKRVDKVEIRDVEGRTVYSLTEPKRAIQVDFLDSGLYIVYAYIKDEIFANRVIKH